MKTSNRLRGFVEIILIVVVLVIGVTALFSFALKSRSEQSESPANIIKKVLSEPTPTPFPFRDLTIPYLKERTYMSTLGAMDKVNENTLYTSYVASYNSDGLKINGLLTVPKTEKPVGGWPAVIFVHGYIAPEVYKTQVNYVSWIDYLARHGYAVFKIDLRGHDKSEGVAGGAYYSSDYVIDTINAHTALQNTDFVNPKAIGLWGHSMAGNIVFRSLVVKTDIPVAVIWAGAGYTYMDLQEYMIQDNSYRPPPMDSEQTRKRQKLRDTYGNFDPENWFWKQVPATNYLAGIKSALLINHAVDDDVVSIEYSRNLINLLNQSAIKHELVEYSSGGHNLTGASFSKALLKTEEFFKTYLK